MINPRKFSEKIALHNQKQAEETAAFEQIMKEVGLATRRDNSPCNNNSHISINGSSLAPCDNNSIYYGGSLPNVNQAQMYKGIIVSNSSALLDNGCPNTGVARTNGWLNTPMSPTKHEINMAKLHQRDFKSHQNMVGIDLQDALYTLNTMKGTSTHDNYIAANKNNNIGNTRHRGSSLSKSSQRARSSHNDRKHNTNRIDCSPYTSPYLSPPSPDSCWRRTNSDSALNQSSSPADLSSAETSPDARHFTNTHSNYNANQSHLYFNNGGERNPMNYNTDHNSYTSSSPSPSPKGHVYQNQTNLVRYDNGKANASTANNHPYINVWDPSFTSYFKYSPHFEVSPKLLRSKTPISQFQTPNKNSTIQNFDDLSTIIRLDDRVTTKRKKKKNIHNGKNITTENVIKRYNSTGCMVKQLFTQSPGTNYRVTTNYDIVSPVKSVQSALTPAGLVKNQQNQSNLSQTYPVGNITKTKTSSLTGHHGHHNENRVHFNLRPSLLNPSSSSSNMLKLCLSQIYLNKIKHQNNNLSENMSEVNGLSDRFRSREVPGIKIISTKNNDDFQNNIAMSLNNANNIDFCNNINDINGSNECNNTGSLPDLSSLHFPSSLHLSLDNENYIPNSREVSQPLSSPLNFHHMSNNDIGVSSPCNNSQYLNVPSHINAPIAVNTAQNNFLDNFEKYNITHNINNAMKIEDFKNGPIRNVNGLIGGGIPTNYNYSALPNENNISPNLSYTLDFDININKNSPTQINSSSLNPSNTSLYQTYAQNNDQHFGSRDKSRSFATLYEPINDFPIQSYNSSTGYLAISGSTNVHNYNPTFSSYNSSNEEDINKDPMMSDFSSYYSPSASTTGRNFNRQHHPFTRSTNYAMAQTIDFSPCQKLLSASYNEQKFLDRYASGNSEFNDNNFANEQFMSTSYRRAKSQENNLNRINERSNDSYLTPQSCAFRFNNHSLTNSHSHILLKNDNSDKLTLNSGMMHDFDNSTTHSLGNHNTVAPDMLVPPCASLSNLSSYYGSTSNLESFLIPAATLSSFSSQDEMFHLKTSNFNSKYSRSSPARNEVNATLEMSGMDYINNDSAILGDILMNNSMDDDINMKIGGNNVNIIDDRYDSIAQDIVLDNMTNDQQSNSSILNVDDFLDKINHESVKINGISTNVKFMDNESKSKYLFPNESNNESPMPPETNDKELNFLEGESQTYMQNHIPHIILTEVNEKFSSNTSDNNIFSPVETYTINNSSEVNPLYELGF
ncbi:unnamed protein product [Gordionus sp. m RMFG-2023]|uniref:putative uncharacterized protein DDB_G0282133 isoform X1 n=1 Tax=Gordionus sp. m RMFG-2023 TaxID=3053472 RepID=UPI0030DF1D2F